MFLLELPVMGFPAPHVEIQSKGELPADGRRSTVSNLTFLEVRTICRCTGEQNFQAPGIYQYFKSSLCFSVIDYISGPTLHSLFIY